MLLLVRFFFVIDSLNYDFNGIFCVGNLALRSLDSIAPFSSNKLICFFLLESRRPSL
jgi:hypothetical protein